jgi:hypothetical protein
MFNDFIAAAERRAQAYPARDPDQAEEEAQEPEQ